MGRPLCSVSCGRAIICDEIFMSLSRVDPFHKSSIVCTHILTHKHTVAVSLGQDSQSHIQKEPVIHHGKGLSGPQAETENLLHYCCSQFKYCVNLSVCLCLNMAGSLQLENFWINNDFYSKCYWNGNENRKKQILCLLSLLNWKNFLSLK